MTYYELLEIAENASSEVIKAAYKVQVAKYHPDNAESGDLEKMQEINVAFEILSDPVRRREYDKGIKDGVSNREAKKEEQKMQKNDETQNVREMQNMNKANGEQEKLKWYLSVPAILFGLFLCTIPGIVLFIMRCSFLCKNKDIVNRKKKIRNTWITLFATIALFILGSMPSGADNNTSQISSADTKSEKSELATEAAETENFIDVTEQKEETEDEDTSEPLENIDANKVKENVELDKSAQRENATETILSHNVEAIENSLKKYAYNENPYYMEGVKSFVSGINEFYDTAKSGQKAEIRMLDDVLKEAGVSKRLRKKVASSEGKNVLADSDFRRMELKKDKKIFFSKGQYYEVSSKAKDDLEVEDITTIVYYLGDVKDNKPDGEGAFFCIRDTGMRLLYAGGFKEGRMNGKGVLFSVTSPASIVFEMGSYENGVKSGKCVMYNCADIHNILELYGNSWIEYEEQYFQYYNKDEKNQVIENLFEKDKAAELIYIAKCYEAINLEDAFYVRTNYAVIEPIISYEGEYKKDNFSGKGALYGGYGTLWYRGEFKSGQFHGKGTLYYALAGIPEYEGEFKRDKMNGKGTLYNEDGTVRKKGNFDNEEINSEYEELEEMGIYSMLCEKFEEAGVQKVFEKNQLIFDESINDELVFFENEDEENENDYWEEYILPGSDSVYLDQTDLQELSAEECRIARNEIYARHGRIFQDDELQEYFEQFSWYEGMYGADEFDDSVLNDYEKANLDLISNYESEMGYK